MLVPRLLGLAILFCAGVASAEPPAKRLTANIEQESADTRAKALNDEAWALYESGRYRAAIDKLEEAVRLDPKGKDLVYNLALIHEKLAHFDAAATHYKRYLEMESDPKAKARVQAIVKRLEGARHEGDERRGPSPVALPPARELAPVPAPAPRPVRPWVIATGAAAGTAFLLGSIFALNAVARNPGAGARTGDGVTIDDLSRDARAAHTSAVVADVAYLVALAATGTATFLYFTTPRATSARAASLHVAVSPGAMKVTW